MLRLNANIVINRQGQRALTLDFVNRVEIVATWEEMTATATVSLPKNIRTSEGQRFIGGPEAQALFTVGDEITISLGYDDEFVTEYEGYIKQIEPGFPVRLICEDGMFNLKRTSLNVPDDLEFAQESDKNEINLKNLVDKILTASGLSNVRFNPGVQSFQSIELGKFRVKGEKSVAEIFKKLKDYGLAVFFRGRHDLFIIPPRLGQVETLVAPSDGALTRYVFEDNVIDKSGLKYVSKEERKVNYLGVSVDAKTNEKVQFPAEKEPGVNYTKINLPENLKASEVERFVKDNEDQIIYDGFEGSFVCFGKPYTRHGEAVEIIDRKVPDRNGNYLVRKTRVTFGVGGFRREIFLWKTV